MNLIQLVFSCFMLLYLRRCEANCTDFKNKCQTFCLAKSGGVATNQCWGVPKYRHCKCSDTTIYFVPGYNCEHPSCPAEAQQALNVKTTTPKQPIISVSQNEKEFGCTDFKKKCQTVCLDKSGGVAINQCWGTPKYRYCKCSDMTVQLIAGYTCDHPTCPVQAKLGK